MADDKVDFSALDPSRDEVAWERRIQAVAARGLAARQRSFTIFDQLRAWRRPALAVTLAAAAASWLLVITSERIEASPKTAEESAEATWSRWALNDQVPQTTEVFQLVEASRDR